MDPKDYISRKLVRCDSCGSLRGDGRTDGPASFRSCFENAPIHGYGVGNDVMHCVM